MRNPRSIAALAAMLVAVSAFASSGRTLTDRDRRTIRNAAEVLESLSSAPDNGIPRELLQRAECVLVFPNVVKGAFVVGGRYGRGVAACRRGEQLGPPAFFSIGGASVGWQWGVQGTDFVLLVMNEDGMKNLLEDKLTIGGNASASIGPVGRTAEAATDAQLQAQILSWSRSRGLFAGASLEGAVVQPSEDANARLYGKEIPVRDILLDSRAHTPAAATDYLETARALTKRSP